jgi:hypothetical protein
VHWTDAEKEADVLDALQLNPGNIEHTRGDAVDFNGTLVFDYQRLKIQITGLLSSESLEFNPAPIRNMLNTARLPGADRGSSLLNVKATYLHNQSMFSELSVSRYTQTREIFDPVFKDNWWVYNDSFAVANANENFTTYPNAGTNPSALDISGFPFNRPGTPTSFIDGDDRSSSYLDEKDNYTGVGGSLTKQSDRHEIKFGFDYQAWTTRRYQAVLNSVRSPINNTYPSLDSVYDCYYAGEIKQGDILNELIATSKSNAAGQGNEEEFQALLRNQMRHYHFGYDVYGNESDASGIDAPRKPVLGAATSRTRRRRQRACSGPWSSIPIALSATTTWAICTGPPTPTHRRGTASPTPLSCAPTIRMPVSTWPSATLPSRILRRRCRCWKGCPWNVRTTGLSGVSWVGSTHCKKESTRAKRPTNWRRPSASSSPQPPKRGLRLAIPDGPLQYRRIRQGSRHLSHQLL